MNTKVLLATLAAGIVAFFFGWLVFGILLADFYAAHTTLYDGLMKTPPNFILIFVSNLCMAFLFAYIFHRWAGIKTAGEGAQAGFIIGALMALTFDLFMFATMNIFTPTIIAVDVIGNGVFGAVMGAVVGLVLGSGKKVVTV